MKFFPLEMLQRIATRLSERFADTVVCQQYARWLVSAVCKRDITQLLAAKEFMLTAEQQKLLDDWLHKLVDEHMPIQYILGTVPFLDLTISVEPPVLIPRPETEEWVDRLCQQLQAVRDQPLTILDLCTGSGCIALALAQQLPQATVYAADVAPYALSLARKNAQQNNISNIVFVQADLFTAFAQQIISFDCIVANPPYIALAEWQKLDVSVQRWEDPLALTAPEEGLAVIKQIITQAPTYLRKNMLFAQHGIPQLAIEIDRTQATTVADLMRSSGYTNIQVQQDFSGQDRVVSANVY